MIQSLARTVAVSVGSTILATLAVNATDMRRELSATLIAGVFHSVEETEPGTCPPNMALVSQALVPFCVDMYEASPSSDCPYDMPASTDETALNLADPECAASSRAAAVPWRFVTQTQAQAACSGAGKRLLTAGEWYKAALGTPDTSSSWGEEDCNVARNIEDGAAATGASMRCVSDAGVYDAVGNVWEWVEETVDHGKWNDRDVPKTGFVSAVDLDGMAVESASAQQAIYGNDRVWADATILAGVLRGGYFGSKEQAGVFSTYAASPPTFSGDAVGFRCAVSVQQ